LRKATPSARARGKRVIPRRCDHHHADAPLLALEFGKRFEAAKARHIVIEKDNVEFAVAQQLERGEARLRFGYVKLKACCRERFAYD